MTGAEDDVTTVPRPATATTPRAGGAAAARHQGRLVSEDWWFCLHWLNLAQRLKERGHEITIICNVGSDRERIELAGFKVVPAARPLRPECPQRCPDRIGPDRFCGGSGRR